MFTSRFLVAIWALLLALSVRQSGGSSSNSWDGTITDIEQESDGRSMSRVLQVNITWSSGDVKLTLVRNDHVPANATVFVGGDDGQMTSYVNNDNTQNVAFYYDTTYLASIRVDVSDGTDGVRTNVYSGSFVVKNVTFVVQPVTESARRKRRKRRSLPDDDAINAYVINTVDHTDNDTSKAPALSVPRETLLVQTLERGDDPAPGVTTTSIPTKLNYVIELFYVVDNRLYLKFLGASRNGSSADRMNETLTNIYSYVAHIANGVDLRYRSINSSSFTTSIRLAGIYIAVSRGVSMYVENNVVGNDSQAYVNAQRALHSFADWLNSLKPNFPVFDQATLITTLPMNGETGNRISGLAYLSGICSYYSVAIIRDQGEYSTTQTSAHELGHSLGAVHDGLQNRCSASDMYVMVASPGQLTDAVYKNAFTFSNCSILEIKNALQNYLSMSSNCLLTSTAAPTNAPTIYPGQMFSVDVQCQLMLGQGSYYCGGQTNDAQICRQMMCFQQQFCYASYEQRAFTGTPCGNKKMCKFGECVADDRAPSNTRDVCVYGDSRIPLPSGYYCSNVTSSNAWLCYNAATADACCLKCPAQYNATRVGCEYGDKDPACASIRLSDCSDVSVNVTCCQTCAAFQTTSVPSTEAAPTTVMGCSTCTDKWTNCSTVIGSSVDCYSYGDSCCAFCSRYYTYLSDCPYGDRDASCASLTTPQQCYSDSQKCCSTCRRLRVSNTTNCEWGDKTPSWCVGISAANCYSYSDTCCSTCSQYQTLGNSIPGCLYGDRDSHWCNENVINLSQCYSFESYCCGRCGTYRINLPGCEYGDREAWCSSQTCSNNPSIWSTCCKTCSAFFTPTTSTSTTATIVSTPATAPQQAARLPCNSTAATPAEAAAATTTKRTTLSTMLSSIGTTRLSSTRTSGPTTTSTTAAVPSTPSTVLSSVSSSTSIPSRPSSSASTPVTTAARTSTSASANIVVGSSASSAVSFGGVGNVSVSSQPTVNSSTASTTRASVVVTEVQSSVSTTLLSTMLSTKGSTSAPSSSSSSPVPSSTSLPRSSSFSSTTTSSSSSATSYSTSFTTLSSSPPSSPSPSSPSSSSSSSSYSPPSFSSSSSLSTSPSSSPSSRSSSNTFMTPTSPITSTVSSVPTTTTATTSTTSITASTNANVTTSTMVAPASSPTARRFTPSVAVATTVPDGPISSAISTTSTSTSTTSTAATSTSTTVPSTTSTQQQQQQQSSTVTSCADHAWWCPFIQASDCYTNDDTCCATCSKFRLSIPGCEFGDRYWWCSSGNFCFNSYVIGFCCVSCRLSVATNCSDQSADCSRISPASCYDSGTRSSCCQTCSKYDNGPTGCEYGDRLPWCAQIDRSQCSSNTNQQDCCQACS